MRGSLLALGAIITLATMICLPERADAWGPKGHELVGKIADKHITKQSRDAISELLEGHQYKGLSDGRLPNWADKIRGISLYKTKYKNNDKWHFLDIDVDRKLDEIKLKDVEKEDNVLMALNKCKADLRNPKKTVAERREALFFIAHFVGDLHQPLHCAMRNNDRGGNLVRVTVPDDRKHVSNLHRVWDSNLVEEAVGSLTLADYTTRLTLTLTPDKRKGYQKGTVEDWILDSHKVAREKVYTDKKEEITRKKDEVHDLSSDYVVENALVVEEQLLKGGVRLAQFLNDAFGD